MDTVAVAELAALADRDADLAARRESLRQLDTEVSSLRARAEWIDAFFAAYPREEARRRDRLTAAGEELPQRRDELAEAEQALNDARETDARERAQNAVRRARDRLAAAESTLARVRADTDELERDASELSQEVPQLEARAKAVSAQSADVPPAPTGVRELVEWAARAHAELFVAAGQLDAERDRVIREANELATMLLGEPTYGSTVAQLAQRVLPLAGK